MKLPPQSVKKLFREDFSGESPIVIDRKNRRQAVREWHDRLEKIDGVVITKHAGDRDSRVKRLCRFTIPDPNAQLYYYRADELRLEYNDSGQLELHASASRPGDLVAQVSSLDEIKQFVRHVLERYARRQASQKKREKVRDFKSKAIIAQVRKLAKDEKFDYATTNDTVKLKLFVRLSKNDLIEIHVPFTRFEKVLPKLKSTIQSLRELYEEGLRFKITPVSRLPWNVEWVDHKTL